jgi:hypothetical protein
MDFCKFRRIKRVIIAMTLISSTAMASDVQIEVKAALEPYTPVSGYVQGATATTQVIASQSSGRIFISDILFSTTGPESVSLVYGTGTNCAVGTTTILPAVYISGNAPFTFSPRTALIVPAGDAICCEPSLASVQFSCEVSGWNRV